MSKDPHKTKRESIISAVEIKTISTELGADIVGIAPATLVENSDQFLDWLNRGYAGEMKYLFRNQVERFSPEKLLPGAKSVVSIGMNYYPTEVDLAKQKGPYKVSLYSWGEDYHYVLRRLLRNLRSELKKKQPRLRGRICVDTAPFMDKYWAQKAGLGWQGKHTNLVSRQFGSWLVLGSLIINIAVDKYDNPHPDHCGNCTACIESCPTGALHDPRRIDATRCISYWTIESKDKSFPHDIEENLNGWVFGCDECLSACPFNRFSRASKEKAFRRRDEITQIETGQVADISEAEFNKLFGKSPINRSRLSGIKRNIKTVLKNT